MEKDDEILAKVTETATGLKELTHRLYGQEADDGDIPAIRSQLKEINGSVRQHEMDIASLYGKVKNRWVIILATSIGVGGGAAAITKIMEFW